MLPIRIFVFLQIDFRHWFEEAAVDKRYVDLLHSHARFLINEEAGTSSMGFSKEVRQHIVSGFRLSEVFLQTQK